MGKIVNEVRRHAPKGGDVAKRAKKLVLVWRRALQTSTIMPEPPAENDPGPELPEDASSDNVSAASVSSLPSTTSTSPGMAVVHDNVARRSDPKAETKTGLINAKTESNFPDNSNSGVLSLPSSVSFSQGMPARNDVAERSELKAEAKTGLIAMKTKKFNSDVANSGESSSVPPAAATGSRGGFE